MGYGEGQATGPKEEWAVSSLLAVRRSECSISTKQTLDLHAASRPRIDLKGGKRSFAAEVSNDRFGAVCRLSGSGRKTE